MMRITCWGIGNSTLLTSLIDRCSIWPSCHNWRYRMLRRRRWARRKSIILWFRKRNYACAQTNMSALEWFHSSFNVSFKKMETMLTALVSISCLWIMMRWKWWPHAARNLQKNQNHQFIVRISLNSNWCTRGHCAIDSPAFVELASVGVPLADASLVHWQNSVVMLDFDCRIHLCAANAASNGSMDVANYLAERLVRVRSLKHYREK